MAKLASAKTVGIPVPDPIPSDVTHLVAYYGSSGFTPSYTQAERIATPIADVPRQTVDGVEYFAFNTSVLPASTEASTDIYFTLSDVNDDEEGDFSPVISVPLDRDPPVALGQPVIFA